MTSLSPSFEKNPDLDQWLAVRAEGRLSVFPGKAELGQGIRTAFAMIAAEELDIDISRVDVEAVNTRSSPNEVYTAGSMSMEHGGLAIRQSAAQARRIMLEAAAEQFNSAITELEVVDGDIRHLDGSKRISYWDLYGDKKFDVKVSGQVQPKSADQYRIVGKKVEALDIRKLATGGSRYLHDLDLPDMVHGRILRPPNYHARLDSCDPSSVESMPGVLKVVEDGSFLAVIAEREEQAITAVQRLNNACVWTNTRELSNENLISLLTGNERTSRRVVDGIPDEEPVPVFETVADSDRNISARYFRPYQMHASMAPSAALAQYSDGLLSVYTHSQGVYPLRDAIADVLDMTTDSIVITHFPGPGCYGHNGADDAALDAALLARALPDRPVLLKWQREDEHRWEPYGPAMVIDLSADIDKDGKVLAWSHDTYSDTHMGRPAALGREKSKMLAAWHLQNTLSKPLPQPNMAYHGGIHRNADPIYRFPTQNITKHLVRDLPLRVSSLRSLGAYANVFAIESFIDELAIATDTDPVQIRLDHLSDPRARYILETVAESKFWQRPVEAEGHGRGLAFARYKNQKTYAAVVIDLNVDDYGQIKLDRALIVADAGQVVDPQGLTSQLEGGLIQSASWTLKEQVTYDADGITSVDWESYPILSFGEIPAVETLLVDQTEQPSLGAGEATQGPTAAAIANAVFDAIGIRLRKIPFTAEQVLAAAAE